MPILTTDEGISATRNASVGGFLIDLDRFAFTEATDVKLSILDKTLAGVPVFAGEIESIEVVGAATIKCNLYIPPGKPVLNSWSLTEVGLYLKSGVLFAHGTFRTPFLKTGEFGLNVVIYVTCARLGEVINVTIGTNTSLGATSVRSLIEPQNSGTNAVIVQDGSSDGDYTTASLALRFGAGGAQWAFVDHHIVYRGRATSVPSGSSLALDPGKAGGFWLNDQEIVTICASFGPGAGRSRRCRYNATTKTFAVLEKPWTITAETILHVWREHKNILPTRNELIPTHYVLGAGANNWKKNDPSLLRPAYDLVQGHISLVGNGSTLVVVPGSVPTASIAQKARVLMFVAGRRLGINEYVIHDHNITFSVAPAAGAEIGLVYYTEVASPGSYLTMMPAEYATFTTGEKQFQLAILPDSKNGLIVFDNGRYIGQSHYTYEGSSITFTDYVPSGPVNIIACANFYEVGATTALYSKQMSLPAGVVAIPVEVEQFEKRNTIVSVNGRVLSKEEYTVSSRLISLVQTRSTLSSVEVFIAASLALLEQPTSTTSGENTGPLWVDPAGVLLPPNRLSPVRLTHIGDGIQRTFALGSRADLALCFLSGVLQDYRAITIDTTNGTAVLPAPVPNGAELDIITFESIPDVGREAVSWRQGFVCDGASRSFVLPAAAAGRIPELTIVSVNGVYIHPSQYSLSLTNIAFVSLYPPGARVDLWHYTSRPAPGFSSRFSLGGFTLSATKPRHIHCFYGDIPVVDTGSGNNTLMFTPTIFMYGSVYTIENKDSFDFIIPGVGVTAGARATSAVIFTGRSKTRLLMRSELEHLVTKRELELATADTMANVDQYYARRDGSNAYGDWNITVALAKRVKLSQDAHNLIEMRADGIYYGTTAPDEIVTMFVDAVNGNDNNVGSINYPVQTIAAVVDRGPSGVNRYIMLKEQQTHWVDPQYPRAFRGGSWVIHPYGPMSDALAPVAGDGKFIQEAAIALMPTIRSRPMFTTPRDAGGGIYQNGIALVPQNAIVTGQAIRFMCADPVVGGAPLSSACGTFMTPYDNGAGSQWILRNCQIDTTTGWFASSAYSPITISLISGNSIVGNGKLCIAGSKLLSIDYGGGAIGSNNSTAEQVMSYVQYAGTATKTYSNFTTNMLPASGSGGRMERIRVPDIRSYTMPSDRIGTYEAIRWEGIRGNVNTAVIYINGVQVTTLDTYEGGHTTTFTTPLNPGDNVSITGALGSTSNTFGYVWLYPVGVTSWN